MINGFFEKNLALITSLVNFIIYAYSSPLIVTFSACAILFLITTNIPSETSLGTFVLYRPFSISTESE